MNKLTKIFIEENKDISRSGHLKIIWVRILFTILWTGLYFFLTDKNIGVSILLIIMLIFLWFYTSKKKLS